MDLSTGRGAKIAIIDTGIDANHPDFAGAGLVSFDALGSAKPEPGTHGTAIAGIIAARGTTRGVAPAATLMSVRAFPADTSKEPQMTTSFVLLKAMDWSLANGARVINLSLAGPRDPLMEKAVAAAAAKGVIMIAAAGNNGDKAPPAYPAAYADVIAVTAIDARDQLYTPRQSWRLHRRRGAGRRCVGSDSRQGPQPAFGHVVCRRARQRHRRPFDGTRSQPDGGRRAPRAGRVGGRSRCPRP